jgi:amino acid permease
MTDLSPGSKSPDEDERDTRPGSHARHASEASIASFTFIPPTLPSYLSRSVSNDDDPEQRHHQLGILEAIALVIGMQIGSGIFSSPGVIVHSTKSVGSSLIVWLVSGLLTWTGASSFAELGSMIPQNGGAQAYLFFAVSELVMHRFVFQD